MGLSIKLSFSACTFCRDHLSERDGGGGGGEEAVWSPRTRAQTPHTAPHSHESYPRTSTAFAC
jgi:hypothetical protein